MADKNEWTDELKTEVAEAYLGRNPTPENTMEIVKELAEEYEKTPNGMRMILTKQNVYVKKTTASTGKTTDSDSSSGTKRVNKAVAISDLKKKITSVGQDVDDDICDRMTGKAALYILGILEAVG